MRPDGSGLRTGSIVSLGLSVSPAESSQATPLAVVTALRSTRRPGGTGNRMTVSGPLRAGGPIGASPWLAGGRVTGSAVSKARVATPPRSNRMAGGRVWNGKTRPPPARRFGGASGGRGGAAGAAWRGGTGTGIGGDAVAAAGPGTSTAAVAGSGGLRRTTSTMMAPSSRSVPIVNPSSGVTSRLAELASISVASLAMPGLGRPRVSPVSMVQAPTTRTRVAGPSAVTVETASAGRRSDSRVKVGSRASSSASGRRTGSGMRALSASSAARARRASSAITSGGSGGGRPDQPSGSRSTNTRSPAVWTLTW